MKNCQDATIIEQLEFVLNVQKKKVILLDIEENYFTFSLIERIKDKFSDVEVWLDTYINDELVRVFSKDEFEKIMKIYMTYDFSDRIILVSKSTQYAGLFNYFHTGILTQEEIIETLLYR